MEIDPILKERLNKYKRLEDFRIEMVGFYKMLRDELMKSNICKVAGFVCLFFFVMQAGVHSLRAELRTVM